MIITTHTPRLLTQQGKRRANQDAIYPLPDKWSPDAPSIFLVCDGVGGEARGEVASRMACDLVGGSLAGLEKYRDEDIHTAIEVTKEAIAEFCAENPEAQGMATTLTLLACDEQGALVAHLGDSRVYHFRAGEILFRTKDHSLVQELIDNGLLSPELADQHPQRNVVTRALMAAPNDMQASIFRIQDLRADDLFLLCSDGILESWTDEELRQLLTTTEHTDEAIIELIHERCAEHSRDNYTACLVRLATVEGQAIPSPSNHTTDDTSLQRPFSKRAFLKEKMRQLKNGILNAFSDAPEQP
ncbi:MAG: protein phosphatase 2C domain-containing protein [Bacteroidota bacterium]